MPTDAASDETLSGDATAASDADTNGGAKKAASVGASKPVKITKARAKASKKANGSNAVHVGKATSLNPRWLVPTMLSLLILGLLWVVLFYVTSAHWAWPLGQWNIAIGFGFIMAGGVLSTQYK